MTNPSTLTEQFSEIEIEALISTAGELYDNSSDAQEYLSVRQQGLASLVSQGETNDLSEDDVEALLITAAELYNNSHGVEEYLSTYQQGLASLALQRLEQLQEG